MLQSSSHYYESSVNPDSTTQADDLVFCFWRKLRPRYIKIAKITSELVKKSMTPVIQRASKTKEYSAKALIIPLSGARSQLVWFERHSSHLPNLG